VIFPRYPWNRWRGKHTRKIAKYATTRERETSTLIMAEKRVTANNTNGNAVRRDCKKKKGKNGTTLRNYYTRVVLSRRGRRRVFSVSLNLYYHDAVSIMFPAPNVSPYIYCACSRIIGNERSRSFTASLRTRNNVSLLVSASFDHRQFDYRRLRHFAAAAQTSRLRCNR